MTAKFKAFFALLLSAATLMATACSFVITEKKQHEDLLIIEKDDPISDVDYKEGKEEQPVEQISPDELENQPTEPVPTLDSMVYEYANVTRKIVPDSATMAEWGDEFSMSFRVPAINLESDNAHAFNEKIFALYPQYAFETEFGEEPLAIDRIYLYDYFSDVSDKAIAAIVIKKQVGYFYSEYGTDYEAFYYDLKGDCEVTAQDYLDSLGINAEEFSQNIQKQLYEMAAHGEYGAYDMSFADEYVSVGESFIAAEEDGFIKTEISGEYGYYLYDFPILASDFVFASCTNDAHIYKTPSHESEVLGVLDGDTEVLVICKATLPEGMQTIEFDENFEWYAVELGDVRGYMLEMELRF